MPTLLPPKTVSIAVSRPPESVIASQRSSIRVPQPRTINRDKMTVEQLLEEANEPNKTLLYCIMDRGLLCNSPFIIMSSSFALAIKRKLGIAPKWEMDLLSNAVLYHQFSLVAEWDKQ
jgi:hypothetical protein